MYNYRYTYINKNEIESHKTTKKLSENAVKTMFKYKYKNGEKLLKIERISDEIFYGIWNSMRHEFQFGIKEKLPQLAQKALFKKIGTDGYKWRFEVKEVKNMNDLKKEYNLLIKRVDKAETYFKANITELLKDNSKITKYINEFNKIITRLNNIYLIFIMTYNYKMNNEEILKGFENI